MADDDDDNNNQPFTNVSYAAWCLIKAFSLTMAE
jgi:hypothetical protein